MQLATASYKILYYPEFPKEMIETVGRTCYRSEDKITESSADGFADRMLENGHTAMVEFGGVVVVRFYVNRGVTHEIVRHRLCSFAQESTRYCCYSKSKFDGQITCIDPHPMLEMKHPGDADLQVTLFDEMCAAWRDAENHYLTLIKMGATAEEARSVLPIGLRSELNVQADFWEWHHILKQRTGKRAHPQMREVMIPLLRDFQSRTSGLWDDIVP